MKEFLDVKMYISKYSDALQAAALVFLFSRFLILLATCLGLSRFPPVGEAAPHTSGEYLSFYLHSWYHYDAIAYVNIASQGYYFTRDTAFFPLWPLLIHTFGFVLGGTRDVYYVVGLTLTNVFFYFVLVLLYILVRMDFEPALARRTLLYLAFSPYALFFFAGYTESLFLLLCLASFLFIRRDDTVGWWLAGLAGFLATLTRATGIVLFVLFGVVYLQSYVFPLAAFRSDWRRRLSRLLPVILLPAGLLVYMFYLALTKGNPLMFGVQEALTWHRHFAFPWIGIWLTISANGLAALNVPDLLFTLVPLLALIVGWRRLPLHYSLFALAMMVFSLCNPLFAAEPLASAPRYMLVIFPVTILFALWAKKPVLDRLFFACSLVFCVLNIMLFVNHYWVA